MTTEIYRRHRPKLLEEVIGQDEIIAIIQDKLRKKTLPHSLLFSGPSGVGKTTISRILANELECGEMDLHPINAASSRGIDTIRSIEERMTLSPTHGSKCRVYILDEAHQLVKKRGGDAQTALLAILEDTPSHVYIFLCTTHPNELLPTIRTRCTEFKLKAIPDTLLTKLLKTTLEKEDLEVSDEVLEKIVELSHGSARKALVDLEAVLGLDSDEDRLSSLGDPADERDAIELARAIMKPSPKWPEIAKLIKAIDISEPERIRQLILSYANSILLSGKRDLRAYMVLTAFESNWFDSGKFGLTRAALEVCSSKET